MLPGKNQTKLEVFYFYEKLTGSAIIKEPKVTNLCIKKEYVHYNQFPSLECIGAVIGAKIRKEFGKIPSNCRSCSEKKKLYSAEEA